MAIKTAIILVNYKDYAHRFLAECRDSLRAQTYPPTDFRVYIVDNASSPESRAYLRREFEEAVILERTDGNYSAANNLGIKQALADGFEVVVMANMDTYFEHDWLEVLVEALAPAEIGLAQSKLLLYDSRQEKKPRLNSLGNHLHFLGFGFTDGYGREDNVFENKEIKGYASGCALAVKKEVLEKIGPYTEEYYMYHDDVEFGWRARLAGYKIVLAAYSRCWHKYDFSRSVRMYYYMERNRYLAILTFYRWQTLLLLAPALLFMESGMLLFSLTRGWFGTKLRIYRYFCHPRTWTNIFSERKKVAAYRVLSDRQVSERFAGRILFQEVSNPLLDYIANPLLDFYWRLVKKIIKW